MAPVGKAGAMLLCQVACAMGHTARVVNPLHKVDTWCHVDELKPAPEKGEADASQL